MIDQKYSNCCKEYNIENCLIQFRFLVAQKYFAIHIVDLRECQKLYIPRQSILKVHESFGDNLHPY